VRPEVAPAGQRGGNLRRHRCTIEAMLPKDDAATQLKNRADATDARGFICGELAFKQRHARSAFVLQALLERPPVIRARTTTGQQSRDDV
jgi:hypothetical protein